jgi:hypothetical protein
MSTEEIVAAIDAIDASDPECAHSELDGLLLICAPDEVKQAAARLYGRTRWWAFA